MTPFHVHIVKRLIEHDWVDLVESHHLIEGLLHKVNVNRDWLRAEFMSHSAERRVSTALSSREPSTHFKWLIFRDSFFRFEVWLHEYKNRELLRPGYAVVPHNHVYNFSSLILSGGFKHVSYAVVANANNETIEDVHVSDERTLSRSTVYTLTSEDVHALENIEEGTTTLVINSGSRKQFSEEFNLQSRKVIRHYPLPVRVRESYPFLDHI